MGAPRLSAGGDGRSLLRMRRAVYPGSFDPVTLGHLDIARRARGLFDEVVVAVIENPRKRGLFSVSERVGHFREAIGGSEGIVVRPFSGLLVDFLEEVDARVIVRGLRFVSDFEYEFQMALMNHSLREETETIFLVTGPEKAYLSSTLVKEIAGLGRDVGKFVPENVAKALAAKMKGRPAKQAHAAGEEN